MEHISSLQNPRVKSAIKLRTRRGRDKTRQMIFDGQREMQRALSSGIELKEVFCCKVGGDVRMDSDLVERLLTRNIRVTATSPRVFERIAFGDRTDGIVTVAETPRRELQQISLSDEMTIAVVEGVEKPGNLGAIFRSADATGVSAIFLVHQGTDLFNPNTIRSSLGTVFCLPAYELSGAATLGWLRQHDFQIVATRVDAPQAYTKISFARRTALVLGSEMDGLSPQWNDESVTPISLPMCGIADSLNVSATAAVLFYEVLRQKQHP